MDKNEIISRVKKLLQECKNVVMVLTVDRFNAPHGRYMDGTLGEDGLTLHFASFVNTDKVQDLRNNPSAEVIISGKDLIETASISGTISFCSDNEDKAYSGKKSFLISRFPGVNPEDIVIFKFVPKSVKYLNRKAALRPLPIYKIAL